MIWNSLTFDEFYKKKIIVLVQIINLHVLCYVSRNKLTVIIFSATYLLYLPSIDQVHEFEEYRIIQRSLWVGYMDDINSHHIRI